MTSRARHSRHGILLVALTCLAQSSVWCQSPTVSHPDPSLTAEIDAILDAPALRSAHQGVLIQSLEDGRTLYERNAERAFLPASNNKLLTSAASLVLLPPEMRFQTILYRRRGSPGSGKRAGDLILCGTGDPLTSPQDIARLAQACAATGVRQVRGHLYYEASRFDSQPLGDGWQWDDEPYYYAAQVSALNFNRNLINIQTLPGARIGAPVRIVVGPLANYVRVLNAARTAAKGSANTLKITRRRGQNVIEVQGALPIDKRPLPVGVTVEAPERYAAFALIDSLRKRKVVLDHPAPLPIIVKDRRSLLPVTAISSRPLTEIVRELNKVSDNHIAECLLKALGAERGKEGSAMEGARVVRDWLLSIGLEKDQFRQVDGSGLSTYNVISPRSLVRLLAYMDKHPQGTAFRNSLPIAGRDGTLKKRMKGTAAEGNCQAKTGTLSIASSLSGYVTTRDGKRLAFSILMNNCLAPGSAVRAAQDQIVERLAYYIRKPE